MYKNYVELDGHDELEESYDLDVLGDRDSEFEYLEATCWYIEDDYDYFCSPSDFARMCFRGRVVIDFDWWMVAQLQWEAWCGCFDWELWKDIFGDEYLDPEEDEAFLNEDDINDDLRIMGELGIGFYDSIGSTPLLFPVADLLASISSGPRELRVFDITTV